MGVYTGTEDFSKPVVRQLMVWYFWDYGGHALTGYRLNDG
jgi:hypothetical protein